MGYIVVGDGGLQSGEVTCYKGTRLSHGCDGDAVVRCGADHGTPCILPPLESLGPAALCCCKGIG